MRPLTENEQIEIKKRRQGFDQFLSERMPVLTDFMERLGLSDAALVLVESDTFLPHVDKWMRDQVVTPADEAWLVSRLGYFVGEYLVQQLSGCWFLNELPESAFFARYVVGRFARTVNPNAMVDPFVIAQSFALSPPGRSLSTALKQVEQDLQRA